MPKYTEKDLQEAVREVHQGTSQRSAAKRWHIPRATLQDRLNGGISHAEAHECRQRFSRQQEKLLSRWIFHLVALGVPPTQGQFEEFASRVLVVHGDSQPLGKHWVQGFLRRNSEVKLAKGKLSHSFCNKLSSILLSLCAGQCLMRSQMNRISIFFSSVRTWGCRLRRAISPV